MVQEHERGLGNWQAEWETIPQIFNLCAGALEKTNELIAGLEVDTVQMSENLRLTQGLIHAEAVAMALASHVGKATAHRLVEQACKLAMNGKRNLREVLAEDAQVSQLIAPEELDRLFDPTQYLGMTARSIELVLARTRDTNKQPGGLSE
jgi:3-carboxy-cis,cis-muconate cycloisomerase